MVDLGAIAMKRYSAFPKAPAFVKSPSDNLVSYPEHSVVVSYSCAQMQLV